MYYGSDEADDYRPVAYYVDRIPEGSQARRSACRAAHQVRAGDQSQDGEADRPDDSAGGARSGESTDQVMAENQAAMPGLN
jgi:hypothetical protein